MTQRGGRRPGSGRKPMGLKRVLHQTPVQLAEAKIAQKLPWLVDKLIELVEGVEVERVDRQGERRIYSQPPDRQAAEYLIDRVMGKSTQTIDVTHQVEEIAADFGVEPERVTSIVERLKAKRAG